MYLPSIIDNHSLSLNSKKKDLCLTLLEIDTYSQEITLPDGTVGITFTIHDFATFYLQQGILEINLNKKKMRLM